MKLDKSWSAQIHAELSKSKLSGCVLAKVSGVPQPTISNFLRGKKGLSLESAEKLCRVLNIVLTKGK